MNRLDRFVLRELVVPFVIGTLLVVVLFQANAYIYIAKTFNVENIPVVARFQWIMYETPGYMKLTLPVGMSLATALALTRITRDSELTAIRGTGTSVLRLLLPILLFRAVVGIANFYLVDKLVPLSNRKANDLARKNEYLGMEALMKSNSYLQLDDYSASLGTVTKEPDETLDISDVLLIQRSAPEKAMAISARKSHYDRGVWTLYNAMMLQFDGTGLGVWVPKKPVTVNQQFGIDQMFNNSQLAGGYMEEPTPELRQEIARDIAGKTDARPAQIELYSRYAIPVSCVLFALTSSIFAIWFGRSGGFVGVMLSLLAVLVYYNSFVISTQFLAKLTAVPPWLVAWAPNMLFLALGVAGLRRVE